MPAAAAAAVRVRQCLRLQALERLLPGDVGRGFGDDPHPLKFAMPLLMKTRFPWMNTPIGLMSIEPPDDLIVNPMPASMTAVIPAFRWIIMPASMA